MPTTYKVLGQTTTTVAAASTVNNLIPDPVVNVTTMSVNNITSNQPGQITSTGYQTQWRGAAESNTNQFFSGIDNFGAGNANAAWQGTNSLWAYNNSGSTSQLGFTTAPVGSNGALGSTGNITVGGVGPMPVSASTTYYYGAYINATNATSYSGDFRVKWYTSAGVYISESTFSPTFATGTWTKNSGSATSPSTAGYATVGIYCNMPNSRGFGIDGIWFSSVSGSTTTFPTPDGANLTMTAPFSTRISNTFSGTSNASSTVTTNAGALTDLYTVPASTSTVASTLTLANLGTTATTYRVLVLKSGETAAKKNFIAFDEAIAANSSVSRTLGMTLATGDKIQVASDVADVSATLFGSEIS
jgi:hypothetical protein